MNKFSKINFILLFLLLTSYSLLFGFVVVSAQEAGATKFNLETGVEAGAKAGAAQEGVKLTYPWSAKPGEKQNLGDLVSKFYNIALGLVGVAALAAIIYGGILWTVSKSPSGSQEAKDWITGAIWGLLLLLGAYLLFNTIGIIKEGGLVEPEIPEVKAPAAPTPTAEEVSITGPIDTSKPKEAQLRSSGIQIRSSKGCNANTTGCTYVEGLPQSAIDKILNIYKGCNLSDCKNLAVTGAAEPGHESHGVNKPVVDLARTQGNYNEVVALGKYLESNKEKFGIEKILYNPHGSGYHVHVEFKN